MIQAPPELMQQLQEGQQSKVSYANINPVMESESYTKILRASMDCPIPKESAQLNDLIKKLAQLDPSEELIQTLANGVAVVLCADKFCDAQIKRRPVIKFEEDEKLAELHNRVGELLKEIDELDRLRVEKTQEIKKVAQERWDVAVKNYGLNPTDRLYSISEQNSNIELLDLDCLGCKGSTKMRKARQEVAGALLRLSALKKESKDDGSGKNDEGDGPSETGAGEGGEALVSK